MTQKLALRALLGITLLLCAAVGGAQTSLPLPVLMHPASARALGLGGASVVLDGDDAALFSNPALIHRLRTSTGNASAGVSIQPYLASSVLSALSLSASSHGWRFGLGVQSLDYGSSPEIIPDPATSGETGIETGATVSAVELAVLAGAARPIGAHLVAGVSAKALHQVIVGESGTDAAFDIGAVMHDHAWTMALAAQNLGAPFTVAHRSSALPRLVRVGGRYDCVMSPTLTVSPDAELTVMRGGDQIRSAAVEASWKASSRVTAQLRGGYRGTSAESVTTPFTAGGGLAAGRFAIDYAYQRLRGVATNTHRIGVRWTL